MLLSLQINNFALVDKLDIKFESGLNVMTGETGAGKSILIDAVSLAIGGRASSDFIRTGENKAIITAVFVEKQDKTLDILDEIGIIPEEDGTIIMQRQLTHSGRNNCRINGQQVTLTMYKKVGALLLDIYGQHDNQSLLSEVSYLEALDDLVNNGNLLQKTKATYRELKDLKSKIDNAKSEERKLLQDLDLWKHQVEEISNANLRSGEEDELLKQKEIAVHWEKLSTGTDGAYKTLYEGRTEGCLSVRDELSRTLNDVEEMANIDSSYSAIASTIEDCIYKIDDVSAELREKQEQLQYNAHDIDEIETRLTTINNLKRKYGNNISEILSYLEETIERIEQAQNYEHKVEEWNKALAKVEDEYRKVAQELSQQRQQTAEHLENLVSQHLKFLEMKNTQFKINLTTQEQPSAKGLDRVEFLISPNPGEPLRPVAKIASGGELSRMMLALKAALNISAGVETLIFDEIDTGVGGKAIQAIGKKLSEIAEKRQVICVTHSPQIASYAKSHHYIEKKVVDGRTFSEVVPLSQEERVREIARMLSGDEITKTTLEHAREMLELK
ncbi:DNA repair protein RecN (Recombination protein N) [Desulfitispora alkaliphila]|uniref:DNA repair protein RecN n=1 Tax=Desulfitispora alkaliphila TaxID=622674 RepID=UPI003D218E1C